MDNPLVNRRTSFVGRVATAGAVALASVGFVVAGLLSSAPRLLPSEAPNADEVRRARNTAVELVSALSADGTPHPVRFAERDLLAAATLANHGFDWLRLRPAIESGRLVTAADLRLAERTWLNLEARAEPAGDFPDVHLRVGAWTLPPALVRLSLRAADAWVRWQRHQLPPVATMVRGFHVDDDAVGATLAVPQQLFRVAREVLGATRAPVDPTLVRAAYGRLLAGEVTQPSASVAAQLRRLFGERPRDVDPVEYNRAAFVALAMFAVDPSVRRLAGGRTFARSHEEIQPPGLLLGDRNDLAKHFALSAAMGAAVDPRFTRAIGEWKELDDSLPGGSGFSFVDLAADRAGLHLGRAAVDPATAAGVADRLAGVTDATLFPGAAGAFDEGLSNEAFTRRYGGLEARAYAAKIARVDEMLRRLPLYGPYVPS